MLRTCSARRNPINVIEVQKMIEQFYAMLRAGFERKLKNEGLNILINKFYCVLFGNTFLNQHV